MQQSRTIFLCTMLLAIVGASIPSGYVFAVSTNSSPIALTSDDKFVWVVNPNVEFIEPIQNDSITEPWGCTVTPDGKKVYIANFSSDEVSVIRTSDDKVIRTIKLVGPKPRALAISEDGSTVFVTLFLAQLRPGKTPADEGTEDGREDRVVVINTKQDRVVDAVALAPIDTGFASRGDVLNRIKFVPDPPPSTGGTPNVPTMAFPNLLQSVVIKDNRAYLPGTVVAMCGGATGERRHCFML